MSIGKVQINNLNLSQGEITAVENHLLFVGSGKGDKVGKLLTVNTDSDLSGVLAGADGLLAQVTAARDNGGQNWSASVMLYDAEGGGIASWSAAVDEAMELAKVEGVVLTEPLSAVSDIEAMQAKSERIMAKYMRPVWFAGRAPAFDADSQSWEEYATAIKPLTADVAADACLVTPTIWGPELGTLMGRLCNAAVTVADSPMRVATGALVGAWTERPEDKAGRRLDMSVLESLDKARFSVPQWYPDYEGMYWADGNVLDVNGGDFQVIENVRVIMKAMRRVYPLAVARIADRRFNSTPASIAQNKTYFMRPLREMSRSVTILGQTFPGEIYPPEDGDITMSWPSRTSVELYMAVRPYNCPKKITCNLFLDLNNYAA